MPIIADYFQTRSLIKKERERLSEELNDLVITKANNYSRYNVLPRAEKTPSGILSGPSQPRSGVAKGHASCGSRRGVHSRGTCAGEN